jgi:biopolymer transport protein ExbD
VGAGITIPKTGSEYDYRNLTDCVARLKKAAPEFEDETQVTVTANPDIDYAAIVRVMDAVRADSSGEELFPDVLFALTK